MKTYKTIFFLTGLILLQWNPAPAQSFNWQWASGYGGTNNDYCTGETMDADGNFIITGSFNSPILTFGNTTLINVSPDDYDIYVVKINPDGEIIWAVSAGSDNSELASAVAVDPNGFIYIGGHFLGSSFVAGADTLTNTSLTGMPDIFLARLDREGNFLNALSSEGYLTERIRNIVTDDEGNVYITGDYLSAFMVLGTDTIHNKGIMDVFLAKIDTDQNFAWAKNIGGSSGELILDLITDGTGSLWISGTFYSEEFFFDTIPFVGNGSGSHNSYVFRCDTDGNLIWSLIPENEGIDNTCERLALTGTGNLLMVGRYNEPGFVIGEDTLGNNSQSHDIWLAEFNGLNQPVWTTGFGSDLMENISAMAPDGDGGFLLAGSFQGSSLVIGSDTLLNPNPDLSKAFLAKFQSGGTGQMAFSPEGNGSNEINHIHSFENNTGFLISGHYSSDSLYLGNHCLYNQGDYDIFRAACHFQTTGISVQEINSKSLIYPNPSNGSVILKTEMTTSATVSGRIYDSKGIEVMNFELAPFQNTIEINLQDRDPGLYHLILCVPGKAPSSQNMILY